MRTMVMTAGVSSRGWLSGRVAGVGVAKFNMILGLRLAKV
jgi:hypothetical protein